MTLGAVGNISVWHLLAFATFATFAFYTNPSWHADSNRRRALRAVTFEEEKRAAGEEG